MNIKSEIREYFKYMLEEDFDIDTARGNLIELIEEIAVEYK